MALLIWVLTGICDISSTLTLIWSVWVIPTSTSTLFSLDDEGQYVFSGITWVRKCSVIAVQLIRIIIAVALLYGGTFFLVYTIAISDLILNAMVCFLPTPKCEFVVCLMLLIVNCPTCVPCRLWNSCWA